ncbi:trehalose-6-phosphate synthase [Chloroflexota bacterium]
MKTKESLQEFVKDKFGDYLFVVVSNREPYYNEWVGDEIECVIPASGLTTALDPVMRACKGIWIAHGSGNADREVVDDQDKIPVPPESPSYTLRRVWLTKEEEDGYYYGFSNDAIWPLCHVSYTRPSFNESDWNIYKSVNETFAQAVLEEVGDRKAFVFVQDYHFTLLPRLIKQRNPNIMVAQFWHIPWPNPEVIRICPWQQEMLHGLLGNDLLGFHIRYFCDNFLNTVNWSIECKVDWERHEVSQRGKRTRVDSFPISIDFAEISSQAQQPAVTQEINRLRKQLGLSDEFIGVGVDRIDYTKGVPDRLRAIDRFFENYPDYQQRVVFVQVGAQSRIHLGSYKRLNEEIDALVENINWKYASGPWSPIIYLRGNIPQLTIMALRRMAHFCIVSSLHDGMNLVAKEFVASRFDEDGVLILSPFTGAARELTPLTTWLRR